MDSGEQIIADHNREMNGEIPEAMFRDHGNLQRIEPGHIFYHFALLDGNLPFNKLKISIESHHNANVFLVADDNDHETKWNLFNGTVTRTENGEEIRFEETKTKEQFLNELISLFFKDAPVFESVSFEGHFQNVILPNIIKTKKLELNLIGEVEESAFSNIVDRVDESHLASVSLLKLCWTMRTAIENCRKFSNSFVFFDLGYNDFGLLSSINCKKIWAATSFSAVSLFRFDSVSEKMGLENLQNVAEHFAKHRDVGFLVEISLEKQYEYKDYVELLARKDAWKLKLFENSLCASYSYENREVNVYFELSFRRIPLMINIVDRGSASVYKPEYMLPLGLSHRCMISKYLPYSKREELKFILPMKDTPYFINKIVINCRKETIVIDGFTKNECISPHWTLDGIFENQESKVNIMQIDGSVDNLLKPHFFLNVRKLILNFNKAHPHHIFWRFLCIETLVATSKVTIENGLKHFEERNIPIEYVGGYVDDPESEESEQEEEDEEENVDVENQGEGDEANDEILEFFDEEEEIENNDEMDVLENTDTEGDYSDE